MWKFKKNSAMINPMNHEFLQDGIKTGANGGRFFSGRFFVWVINGLKVLQTAIFNLSVIVCNWNWVHLIEMDWQKRWCIVKTNTKSLAASAENDITDCTSG